MICNGCGHYCNECVCNKQRVRKSSVAISILDEFEKFEREEG